MNSTFYEELPTEVDEDTSADVDLEDMEVSFESEDEVAEAEPETEEAESDETEAEPEDEKVEDTEDEPVEEPEVSPDQQTLPEPEDKQKQHNREMAEKRIQEREARLAEQKQKQQEYVAEAEDDKDLALRQLQVDAYDNKVERNTNKLTNGYERAVKDFEILRDPAPEIQAEVNAALDAFQAMHVTVDKFGNPTDVRGDLYAYLQAKADSITALTGKGARQQIASKDKEKSKVLTTPVRAPKEPKKDPMLEGFDEEAARW